MDKLNNRIEMEIKMTVKEIIEEYLRENGYDGLADLEKCGCGIDKLAPCLREPDGIIADCAPAYKKICGCGDHFYTEDKTRTDCYNCRD